jgi:hypothetical protein
MRACTVVTQGDVNERIHRFSLRRRERYRHFDAILKHVQFVLSKLFRSRVSAGLGEGLRGELRPLVGVEDLRPAEASERLLQRLDAEAGVERVRQAPGQHPTQVPVQDRYQ